MKSTICLCMIVKDESHIIENTLIHLLKYIKFDHWVIVDTGSTDNTIQIINNFFFKQSIPGKVYETQWKDFGFNRTDAFDKAFNLTDYVFVWDADDSITGNFCLPDILTEDSYRFIFSDGVGFKYSRCQLFNNRKKWKYVGVLHEYPLCIDQCRKEKDVIGDYYFISGRSGSRNKDPNKYSKDATILEKAYFDAVENNDQIQNRYAFYCAQSYNSANMKVKAIEWYKKVLTLNTWHQEKYISCLEIYNLYEVLDKVYDGLPYLVESYRYDKYRIECFYRLIKYYCIHDLPEISNMYYHQIKSYFENIYPIENQSEKLFLKQDEYLFYLPYYMIIVACKINNYELAGKMYEIIFKYRFVEITQWWIHNLFYNIQFCIEQLPFNSEFIKNMFSYIHLLGLKNITLNDNHNIIINKIIDRYRPIFTNSNQILPNLKGKKEQIRVLFSITTCKRLDLFKKTIYSILNNWLDIDKIDYFLCVDDNSSEEDRNEMKTLFPFFNYIIKKPEERGHRESMNIIWLELQKLKPTFWIHMEDDWMFFQKENYVTKGIQFLDKYETMRINQIVFNKTYGLMYSDLDRVGGIELEKGLILHEKRDGLIGKNCAYWPHYSLQPSITRTKVILELGNYNSENTFFERDYANNYDANNYKTAFFPSIYSLHIGKQHWETDGKNAYALNEVSQFNLTSESKIDNTILYNGYSDVFDIAIKHFNEYKDKITLLKSFRSHYTIYGFTENGDNPPDEEAISISKEINNDMYNEYLDLLKGRAIVGYEGSTLNYANYNNLDSRHIMMSILLFSSLCKPLKTIVEVGGGYGNWLYLNRTKKFNKWIIIDLPHVSELQKYYLTNTHVNLDNVQFVSAFNYEQVESEDIDLVIGAHSLSEVSFDIFTDYFKRVISKSNYFLYCYHKFKPSLKLIDAKIKMINTQFILANSIMSENGNVENCLYINRKDTKKKNLVYMCVFYNKDYIKLLELLLISIKKYCSLDRFDILILTSPQFKDNINDISQNMNIHIMCIELSTIFEAAWSRLLIFDYPNLWNYENILYLDTDIIIKKDLTSMFNLIIDEKLYGLEQGNIQSLHFGKQFFDSNNIDETITGINSGTLLFKNCLVIKELFCRIRKHIDSFSKSGDPIPYALDQPFINYHAIKDLLYDNKILKPYISLYENVDEVNNYETSIICHFSFPIGNFNHKYNRMNKFLANLLKDTN